MGRALLGSLLVLTACSDPAPVTAPTPEELREQIHAATGHEPTHCTDMTGGEGVLRVGGNGPDPECLIVSAESGLTVINTDGATHTFLVSDPANTDVVRHIRVEAVIEGDGQYVLDPVSSLLGVGIYPYWLKGEQESGQAGTMIVRSP
ncbi:MAG: hypothetical protein L0Z47_02865 [Actinobacteria bacterium]|nr:hypothetical protein [Actinomycetota bacterium]